MKTFLKFSAALTIAITFGIGVSIIALWHQAEAGNASVDSQNPYARAAFAARDLLPSPAPQPDNKKHKP